MGYTSVDKLLIEAAIMRGEWGNFQNSHCFNGNVSGSPIGLMEMYNKIHVFSLSNKTTAALGSRNNFDFHVLFSAYRFIRLKLP